MAGGHENSYYVLATLSSPSSPAVHTSPAPIRHTHFGVLPTQAGDIHVLYGFNASPVFCVSCRLLVMFAGVFRVLNTEAYKEVHLIQTLKSAF